MHTAMNTYARPVPPLKNPLILDGLLAAQRCFDWLVAEGFQVMGLDIGGHPKPLILIQTCAKCAWLGRTHKGFDYKLFPVQGSRATMMRVHIFDCWVDWVERGH